MPLNLTHLAAFLAVAEAGSVSRGAESLMVSQPAVSKQVRLLEQSLSTQLFHRHAKGVTLTETGATLADYARRIFNTARDAEEALADLTSLRRGKLAIAASTTIGTYLLPQVFVAFRKAFPAVRVTLEVAPSAVVAGRVAGGDVHLGFVESPCEARGITLVKMGSDEMVGIVSPRNPLAANRNVAVSRFCSQPFVVRETGSETKSFVELALLAKGLAVHAVMSLGSTEAIKRAVSADIGVAIVSRLSIALELEVNALATVQLSGLRIRRPLYRVALTGRQESPTLKAFLHMLPKLIG